MRKLFILAAIASLVLTGWFFVINNYIYDQKQGDISNIIPYKGTLTGEYVCLPHKNTNGPQTLECAFGLKTNVDEYYALDFNLMPQKVPTFKTGERYSATGTITPVGLLSSEQKYNIHGILSVTEFVQANP